MILEITDSNIDDYITRLEMPLLIHYGADWSGPDRQLVPILEEFSVEYKNIKIGRLNVDENPIAPQKIGVRGVPTMILFFKGTPIATKVGAIPKNTLLDWISSLVKLYEDTDLSQATELIGLTLDDNNNIKFISLNKDGTYKFTDKTNNHYDLMIFSHFESIQYRIAIEELEFIINNKNTKEFDLQNFFERYPNFIINDEYKKAHSQVILKGTVDSEILIPDFILEPLSSNGISDLLDIKLPTSKIYTLKKNRPRFCSAVLEACAQLREYAYYFDNHQNRQYILEKHGLNIFKPKMIVIIGRKGDLDPITFSRVRGDLPSLTLRTYDDIIERIKYKYK